MDSEFNRCYFLEGMTQYGSTGPHNLPLEYLSKITNSFSDERLLGGGGFGKVYKGVLPNGETLAVKKLNSSMPEVTDKQFKNEAYHLMRLKHPYIVLLVGYCSETKETYVEYKGKYIWAEKSDRLLCLEYMPKGNLRSYLSGESSGITWQTRYKIIKGICKGLHYLHEEWQPNAPIIHMDLKPANILLNNNMVPKIVDFGLSRLFSQEKTQTCTTNHGGTLGYMAPEYINKGLISTKSDIFSLGVIIIEIVTGQRDYPDESESGIASQEFTELVLKNWRERLQKSLLEIDNQQQQIRRCIQIGLDCIKLDRRKRPTISRVIKMLHGTESADFSEVCQQQGASMSKAPLEKECQSSTKIRRSLARLDRRRSHALARLDRAHFELDRSVSLFLADSAAIDHLCKTLGLSGPHDFAIPVAEWEAHKAPDLTRHRRASRPAGCFGHQDAVDNDEEEDAVSEDLRLGESTEFWTANSSLSSPSSDEASSRTVGSMFYIVTKYIL